MVVGQFDELSQKAREGDGQAAYKLAQMLIACATADQASLEEYGLDCTGVSQEMLAQRSDFFTLAAINGVAKAQIHHSAIVGADKFLDADTAVKNLNEFMKFRDMTWGFKMRAAQGGSVEALVDIGLHYEQGVLRDRDIVSAYAYVFAAQRTGMLRADTNDLLNQWEEGMQPDQIEDAQRRANEILRWCCN